VRSTATVKLDREQGGRHITHVIATYEEGSPLQALRAVKAHVEAKWESIGALVNDGEILRIEVEARR
jgi:hypothetical protein